MPANKFELTEKYLDGLKGFDKEALNTAIKDAELDTVEVKRAATAGDFTIEEGDEHVALGYSSTRGLDRDNEIVVPSGIDTKQYEDAGSPKLFNHNWSGLPIGKNLFIKSDGFGLAAKTQYGPVDAYDFAREVFSVIKFGSLRTSSIGFIPTEVLINGTKEFNAFVDMAVKAWGEFSTKIADNTGAIIAKSILLEDSIVGVPANPAAITVAVSEKSLNICAKSLVKMGFEVTIESLEQYNDRFKGLFDQSERLILPIETESGKTASKGAKLPENVDKREIPDDISAKAPGVDKIRIISVPTTVKYAKDFSADDMKRIMENELHLKSGKV